MTWFRLTVPRLVSHTHHNPVYTARVKKMLRDCELGNRYPFNRTPFVRVWPADAPTALDDAVSEMAATMHAVGEPATLSAWARQQWPVEKHLPVLVSQTWISPRGTGLYWLSAFRLFDLQTQRVEIEALENQAFVPFGPRLCAEAEERDMAPGAR